MIEYYTANPPKGEIVLMIAPPSADTSLVDYRKELAAAMRNASLKTAVKDIAGKYGLNKNEVYQTALELKNEL